jgi:hypothetical protein
MSVAQVVQSKYLGPVVDIAKTYKRDQGHYQLRSNETSSVGNTIYELGVTYLHGEPLQNYHPKKNPRAIEWTIINKKNPLQEYTSETIALSLLESS